MFSLQIFQKQFAKRRANPYETTKHSGSSRSTAKQQPKIAKRIGSRQQIAADWHPSDSFEPLAMHLFIGASYASAACYPMDDRDVINIGLCVIKRSEMYSEEYKNWIARENESPLITETIGSFKEYWDNAITLVN